ncbi:MAG: hypothetical protein ABI220_02540 [Candidatus Saccharimonadales bacterium]
MSNYSNNKVILKLFSGFGLLAILAGGFLAAFSAHNPSEFTSWASAYLVLVVGILQIGFGLGLYLLTVKPNQLMPVLAFAAYNLGNIGVILGTGLKNSSPDISWLIDASGGLLAVAMVLLVSSVHGAKHSWQRSIFYAIILVIFISMPIGLILSQS